MHVDGQMLAMRTPDCATEVEQHGPPFHLCDLQREEWSIAGLPFKCLYANLNGCYFPELSYSGKNCIANWITFKHISNKPTALINSAFFSN